MYDCRFYNHINQHLVVNTAGIYSYYYIKILLSSETVLFTLTQTDNQLPDYLETELIFTSET